MRMGILMGISVQFYNCVQKFQTRNFKFRTKTNIVMILTTLITLFYEARQGSHFKKHAKHAIF